MADFMTAAPVRLDQDGTLEITEVKRIYSPTSFNNRLIVSAYKKGQLRSKEVNGFAFVEQKTTLQGLDVLMDARLTDGTLVSKGSVAYVKEEVLHTSPWAQKFLEADALEGKFLIIDINAVDFILPPHCKVSE